MAKPFLCRFGVAQISCNPAYADELVACLQEPAFPTENEKVGLFTVSGLDEISRLRQNISELYVAHLNRKVESIVRFAANQAFSGFCEGKTAKPAPGGRVGVTAAAVAGWGGE